MPDQILESILQKISDLFRRVGDLERIERTADDMAGTSFPSSPFTGQRFFRRDLGLLCYWDGTQWLTENEYVVGLPMVQNQASNFMMPGETIRTDLTVYVTRVEMNIRATGTQDASNYWTIAARLVNASYSAVTTAWSTTTAGFSDMTYYNRTGITNRTNASNRYFIDAYAAKTGSPGNISALAVTVYHRFIVT